MTPASLRAESAALEALRKARLAVFLYQCDLCTELFGARLVQPCDDAVISISHGRCEECEAVAVRAVKRAEGGNEACPT